MSGADKNRKNDLSRVQSACGDVLKMTGAMPGKRDIKWPIYARLDSMGMNACLNIYQPPKFQHISTLLTKENWYGGKNIKRRVSQKPNGLRGI